MSFAIVPKLTFKSEVCYRVFCHGIAKGGDCKVMIYKDVVCWVLFRTKFDCNFTQSFVSCIYCRI